MPEDINPQAIFIVVTVFILFLNKVVELLRARGKGKQRERDIEWKDVPPARNQPPIQRQQRPHSPPPRQTPQRQQAPQQRQQPQPPPPRSPFQDVLSDLFEAAGVPVERPDQQQQPTQKSPQPPPIPGIPGIPALRKARRDPTAQLNRAELAAYEKLEKQRAWTTESKPARIHGSIAKMLQSPDSAQQAIVVAEILGPPRSLRELEQR